LCEKLN